jgi:hypothetical protein
MLLTPNIFASVEGEREGEGENEIEIEALSPSPSPKNLRTVQKAITFRALKTKLPVPGQVHPPTLPTANTAMQGSQRQGGQAKRPAPPNLNARRGGTS